ncbi:MAG: VOC family protein [Acidiferrobacterales bacterium]
MNRRPVSTLGLRHVALQVRGLDECERFYTELLGMRVEWRPDADNVYLTTGHDNLALHRASADFVAAAGQRLDHIGYILAAPGHVDEWCDFLRANSVVITREPRTHRDGARSFYCLDPDGNSVQIIYHPPLAGVSAR